MSNTIFYRECPSGVFGAISNRQSTYGKTGVRSSGDHAWLYKKSAFVDATASPDPNRLKEYNTKRESKTITLPLGGFKNLYERKPESGYTPPANITNIKLYNTGNFGSVLRCELAFTVYNLSQLSEHQPFFDIGSRLKVNFGWNGAPSEYYNGNVTFDGIIINFTFSVNPDGSFACTTTALSEGVNVVNVTVDGRSYTTTESDSADASNATFTVASLSSKLQQLIAKLQNSDINTQYGVGKLKIKNDFDDNAEPSAMSYYITLLSLVAQVNSVLDDDKTKTAVKIATVSGSENFTKCYLPTQESYLVSGDPRIIVFPGHGQYDTQELGFANTEFADRFKQGLLDATMINIDWILSNMTNAEGGTKTIGQLFDNIFEQINICSGKRYTLTLAQYPSNSKLLIITDPNYFDTTVKVLDLPAVVNGSVCRNISLVSKVPSAMATQAYFGNNNTGNTLVGPITSVFGKRIDNVDTENIKTVLENAKKLVGKIDFSKMSVQGNDTKKDVDAILNELKTALADVYFKVDTEISQGKRLIPFPVDFTATLDGINGFEFGHTVTCKYLPPVYQQNNIVFTVTKVEHTVQNNDWTTTLSTVCRIGPSGTRNI